VSALAGVQELTLTGCSGLERPAKKSTHCTVC